MSDITTTTKRTSTSNSSPHWFETAIGDARLWGVAAVIGLAIAFSRRSANSDLAVWALLILAAVLVVMIVNTHRWVRASKRRFAATLIAIGFTILTVLVLGAWLTTSLEAPRPPLVFTLKEWLRASASLPWRWIVPSLSIGALIAGVSAFLIFRRRRLIRESQLLAQREAESLAPKVEILSPMNRWSVGWRRTVRGSVFPPDSVVQVLVQFPDDWWYVQSPVEVAGRSWGCQCEFGEAGRKGHNYEVVALHGTSLKDRRYEYLPENAVRSSVRVGRNSNEDEIDCPDKGLHQTKIDDKAKIKDLVMVCGVRYQDVNDGKKPAHIDFGFGILNMSLYKISVASVSGNVTYHIEGESSAPALQPRIEGNEARNIGFRGSGYFVIRQDFKTELERDYYLNASPETSFYFNSLKIALTLEGEQSTDLKTADISFVKKERQWLAYYEGYFIHANLGDQKLALAHRVHNIEKLSEVYGRGSELQLQWAGGRPTVEALKHWAEQIKKALYACHGLSVDKFEGNKKEYRLEVPEESKQSGWHDLICNRLEQLIKEERPQSRQA